MIYFVLSLKSPYVELSILKLIVENKLEHGSLIPATRPDQLDILPFLGDVCERELIDARFLQQRSPTRSVLR